jgi:hypothetical protein
MSITFHCSFCGKKIETPDNSAGKWGKCPSCHNKLYVPDLRTDEELKLAPVDESEEERKKRLMAETYKLEQDILMEKQVPDENAELPDVPLESVKKPLSSLSDKELTKHIVIYLRKMADGDLIKAAQHENLVSSYGQQAIKILDRIALTDMLESELANIPPQVLSGFIRTLRNRISIS